MPLTSARKLLGLSALDTDDTAAVLGTIESVVINPELMCVDGILLGRTGASQNQTFLPLRCITEVNDKNIRAHNRTTKKETTSRRVLGLPAWTTHPHVLVGFVYDCSFHLTEGTIQSFAIHQIIRTWHIPVTAVDKITPKALLIDNDTTIKLKITPLSSEAIG